jgi:hypothetical protein
MSRSCTVLHGFSDNGELALFEHQMYVKPRRTIVYQGLNGSHASLVACQNVSEFIGVAHGYRHA